jgi:hypothetical protein
MIWFNFQKLDIGIAIMEGRMEAPQNTKTSTTI